MGYGNVMKITNTVRTERSAKNDREDARRPVIPDPHVVYYDAVRNSPWNLDGRLPSKDDWSTFRYAVKDIILGVVTHRYNRQTRRLEIRAYFIGEHRIFRELEPTRVMMIVLCSQAYQSGGTMELFFEQGIPFDVRQLIEVRLGEQVSGHEKLLSQELAIKLYSALSDFTSEMRTRIESEVPVELVCFNTYRGVWSSNHIKSLIQHGVPLRWIFMNRPDPLRTPVIYAHLLNHLRTVMMEEYAIHRLADRKLGVSAGKRITRVDQDNETYYLSDYPLEISDRQSNNQLDTDSFVSLERQEKFHLLPIVPHSPNSIPNSLKRDLDRAEKKTHLGRPIIVVPLDFIYLSESVRIAYKRAVRNSDCFLLITGLTMAQLLAEAEFNLAITAAQMDENEVEVVNADRYAD